jgi:hypothetical protein
MGYSLPGPDFPELFIFLWNCATRGHPTRTRPHAPSHPMGRFAHPQTHVGRPPRCVGTHQWAYMMGGRNGCPAGNLRANGPNSRICATRGHPTRTRPHAPPHPMGRFPHPKTHVGRPPDGWGPTNGRIPYRTLGMGGQHGCPAENFLTYPYHGQYQGFPYHTISYQFTIVKRYCTGRWTKSWGLTIVIR